MCSLLGVLQLILWSFSSASAQVNPTTMTFANFDNNMKQKQKKHEVITTSTRFFSSSSDLNSDLDNCMTFLQCVGSEQIHSY